MSVGEYLNFEKQAGSNKFDPTVIDAYELDVCKWQQKGWKVQVKQSAEGSRIASEQLSRMRKSIRKKENPF